MIDGYDMDMTGDDFTKDQTHQAITPREHQVNSSGTTCSGAGAELGKKLPTRNWENQP